MNISYIGDVTLENSCFDSIVQFSFGIADCGIMRGTGSGRYNSVRPILPSILSVLAVLQKAGR